MRHGGWLRRALVLVGTLPLFVAAQQHTALATHGSAGDPLSSAPNLLDTTYGTLAAHDDATEPNGKTSGYTECGTTSGASVYQILNVPAGARVDVDATDDLGGQSLCAIDLFRFTLDGVNLTSVYDDPSRASFAVSPTSFCLTGANQCARTWTLPASDAYFLVFWPAGNGTPDSASFRFTASVREVTSTTTGIRGAFATTNWGCFRVMIGKSFSADSIVSPAAATGVTRFRRERLMGTTWAPVTTYDVTLASGRASRSVTLTSFGRYRIRSDYQGDPERAPSSSAWRCVYGVTWSATRLKLRGYYGTIADYFKYRRGSTITATASMTPTPAAGTVRFKFLRETASGSYQLVSTYHRTSSSSAAVLKISPNVRAGYYRLIATYLGDSTHRASTAPHHCVQMV